MTIELKCPKHPTYKGIKSPTADCLLCGMLWEFIENFNEEVKIFKENGKSIKLGAKCDTWAANYGKPPYYCNPAHCKRTFKTKKEMEEHVNAAYDALG